MIERAPDPAFPASMLVLLKRILGLVTGVGYLRALWPAQQDCRDGPRPIGRGVALKALSDRLTQ